MHATARIAIAVVFVYHGLVPKLLARHPDELAMMSEGGVPDHLVVQALTLLGVAEIGWGLLLLALWRSRWPLMVTMVAMPLTLVGVAIQSPRYLVAAFNPVTLNLGVAALAWIGWLVAGEPSPCSERGSLHTTPNPSPDHR